MRKFIIMIVLLSVLTLSAFADDNITGGAIHEYEIPANTTVVIDNSNLASDFAALAAAISRSAIQDPVIVEDPIDYNVTLQSVNVSTERISASDANGFKAVMLGLLGDYETVITDYEYRNNNNTYTSHSIDITPDWSWICGAGIFAIVVFCAFRLIGGILCK